MMNLVQQGLISEVTGTQNVAYLLNDSNLFFLTGYKVLQSQEKNGFIQCAKLKYNGKLKLLYLSAGYKSLQSLLPALDPDSFMTIVANLLSTILSIKHNGFLFCHNIDISLSKIFIDCNTLTVHLIYLPVTANASESVTASFENDLRTSLIKVINSTPSIASQTVIKISSAMANGTNSLEQIYKYVCSESSGRVRCETPRDSGARGESGQPQMCLCAVNAPIKTLFAIDKPEFVIGKNAGSVDGAVSFNKAISRVHCKIIYRDGIYSVVDLGSANGTYVNGARTTINCPVPLHDGDVLKLANSEFAVSI